MSDEAIVRDLKRAEHVLNMELRRAEQRGIKVEVKTARVDQADGSFLQVDIKAWRIVDLTGDL